MQIPKEQIISLLQSRGQDDQAQQADAQLPDQVDHEEHSDLLQQVGVDPQQLVGDVGDRL